MKGVIILKMPDLADWRRIGRKMGEKELPAARILNLHPLGVRRDMAALLDCFICFIAFVVDGRIKK
jgi:hypothetical protein